MTWLAGTPVSESRDNRFAGPGHVALRSIPDSHRLLEPPPVIEALC